MLSRGEDSLSSSDESLSMVGGALTEHYPRSGRLKQSRSPSARMTVPRRTGLFIQSRVSCTDTVIGYQSAWKVMHLLSSVSGTTLGLASETHFS